MISNNNSTFKVGFDYSLQLADVAIVSTDSRGNLGNLNSFVLQTYGYTRDDMPGESRLKSGMGSVTKEGKKPILLVVTVGPGSVAENLRKNLFNVLAEFRGWFREKTVWIPLLGTGAGALSFEESYSIIVETINKFEETFGENSDIIISIPPDNTGKDFWEKMKKETPEVILPGETAGPAEPPVKNLEGKRFFLAGSYWSGDDQTKRFFENKIWENGHEEKFFELVKTVRPGDTVFLKSAFPSGGKSYLRIKGAGEVIQNPGTGDQLKIDWKLQIPDAPADIESLGKYRATFAGIMPGDLDTIINKVGRQRLKALGLIDGPEDDKKPEPDDFAYKFNTLQKVNINNDGARDEKDFLGFENDIRAFACLIALKDLQPPLAIALFGRWGTGKSFFMHNLQKRIDFLSENQGFENLVEETEASKEKEELFCKGIVQITFNAWSYMDANLWASLVANIFEKLDEYISEQSKGKTEQEKVRKVLNEKLSIINEEKENVMEQQKILISEKSGILSEIKNIEDRKTDLLKQAAEKKYDEIYKEIKKSIPLENAVKEEMAKYGITGDKINELAPGNVYKETTSWILFIKNMMQFSKWQRAIMLLGVAVLLFALINPGNIIGRYLSFSKGLVVSFFTVAGPLFAGFYKTLKRFLKIYEPVRTYRDKFNQELAAITLQYERDIKMVNEELHKKNAELENKNSELGNLEDRISLIENQLMQSITGKAFFDFIKSKRKDERYDKNLSIITVIRRDFETLSELFRDYNIPVDITFEERLKAEEKAEHAKAFKQLFNKPLDRVVLYIDDLDRCPEERVIEVLEAVNLLMAYPLFVVVVGVDPRWIKNSLIKKYALQFTGLLNNTDLVKNYKIEPIHVTDYLEKIFQIPFHLREAESLGINRFLDNVFGNQVREEEMIETEIVTVEEAETSVKSVTAATALNILGFETAPASVTPAKKSVRFTPENLKISKQELQDLKDLAWLIGPNPRSLKRYANIYRIIRAHETLEYSKNEERENFLCIMFILGLSIGRYRMSCADFYSGCLQKPGVTLAELVGDLNIETNEKFKEAFGVIQHPLHLSNAKAATFNRYIPFVKRFSFESNYSAAV